jgi:GNAT superfamily N-acetyltransferase
MIRELKENELDDLLELYKYLHDKDEPLPDRQIIESVWNEIQEKNNFIYFGVFIDEKLIASCTLSVIPNLTRGCRPYGLIENVVTHSEYRRKGYGKAVVEFALQHAWDKSCYKVMLLTGRKNEGTYRFYESAGFDRHAKQAFLAKP